MVQLDSEPSENQAVSSLQCVTLDQLSPETPPCSLCTVTGESVLQSHTHTISAGFQLLSPPPPLILACSHVLKLTRELLQSEVTSP